MTSRLLKTALLGTLIAATTALGGCYVAPYPYGGRYYGGYYPPAPAPVVAPGYYRPYYRY